MSSIELSTSSTFLRGADHVIEHSLIVRVRTFLPIEFDSTQNEVSITFGIHSCVSIILGNNYHLIELLSVNV